MRLALREALLAFRRAPLLSALSVITIAFSLFALGLFGLVLVVYFYRLACQLRARASVGASGS